MSPQQVDETWIALRKQYGTHSTDCYLQTIGDNRWSSKGELIEWKVEHLNSESKKLNLISLQNQLDNNKENYIALRDEMILSNDNMLKQLDSSKTELKNIQKELDEIRSSNKNLTKALKNKDIASRWASLNKRKSEIGDEIAKLAIRTTSFDNEMKVLDNRFQNNAISLENAIAREKVSAVVIYDRLNSMKTRKKQIVDTITELTKSDDKSVIALVDCQLNKFIEIDGLKTGEEIHSGAQKFLSNKPNIQAKQTKQYYLKRLNLELMTVNRSIAVLERGVNSLGTVREKSYVTRQMKNDGSLGGLIVFSRRFNGEMGNIESELSNTHRIDVDYKESTKIITWLMYLLMLSNVVLLLAIFLGLILDIINVHTFYVTAILVLMFSYSFKVQNFDKIFQGMYHYVSTSIVEVPYTDIEGNYRTFNALCFHLELFYSDKLDPVEFFNTTEADLINQQDERLINQNNRLRTSLAQANVTIHALRTEKAELTAQNQGLVSKFKLAKANARAEIKRETIIDEPVSDSFFDKAGVVKLIQFIGSAMIIVMVGRAIQDIVPNAVIFEGNSSTDYNIIAILIAFAVGYFTCILTFRFSRTS